MRYRHPPHPNLASSSSRYQGLLYRWHLDSNLLQALLFLIGLGLVILYSAGNEDVQCIVGKNHIPFGKAQSPSLTDYADGVDVMKFLPGI